MYSLNGIPFKNNFFFERTDGQTDTRTNERTDGRSDYIMPQILFGGIEKVIAKKPLTKYEMNSRSPI